MFTARLARVNFGEIQLSSFLKTKLVARSFFMTIFTRKKFFYKNNRKQQKTEKQNNIYLYSGILQREFFSLENIGTIAYYRNPLTFNRTVLRIPYARIDIKYLSGNKMNRTRISNKRIL